MKSIYDQRRANLRQLIHTWGGPTSLAVSLGTLLLTAADVLIFPG